MQDDEPQEAGYKPASNEWRNLACKIRDGVAGHYIFCLEENRFYNYDKGYWRRLFPVEMQGYITEKMPELNKYPLSVLKQIIEITQFLVRRKLEDFNTNGSINLVNGLLDPWQRKLNLHKSEYLSTIRINYKFDPNAKCDLWTKTVEEILENDVNKRDILQEFFGYCLTRDTRMEKALLLLGESRSGKSTILHTLRALVGSDNCSSVPLKFISNPQYTPLLMNKIINIDSDVSGRAENFEAEFKTITSGEPVSCNQKHIPTFEFNPYCKMVMAANTFPNIKDHSSAFYKRLILIPCNRVFEENEINRDLKHELLEELPGILNWALEGLQRMNKRNGFLQHDFMKEAVEELREESNPSEIFFKDHIEVIQGEEIEKGVLYDKYKEWSRRSHPDGYIMSTQKFSSAIYQKYSKNTHKNSQSYITRKRIWNNIKFIENKDTPKPEELNWQDEKQ